MSQEHRPGTDPTPDRADAAPLPSTEPFWQTSLPSKMRVDQNDGPRLKRAIPAGVLAILALFVGVRMDGIAPSQPQAFEVFGWRSPSARPGSPSSICRVYWCSCGPVWWPPGPSGESCNG